VTDAAVPFRFKVENIEYLGSEWIVSGTLTGGKLDGKKSSRASLGAESSAGRQL